MANTNATTSWRAKWASTLLQEFLKKACVCEAICEVDRGDGFYIWNPYESEPSITIQSISGGSQGTYTPAAYTSTNDTLTITDEFVVSEHVYAFELVMQRVDIKGSRIKAMTKAMAVSIDKFVLNNLCEDGTGTYTTPAGGFTTEGNIPTILAEISSKAAGYAESMENLYLVIENTDLVGFLKYGVGAGFNVADSFLRNGMTGSLMNIDIYVVRTGTFVDDTLGSTTVTNSGHRVAGVKRITTYASPRGIMYDEKKIGSSTGLELSLNAFVGFKAWYQKKALTIDITLA